MAKREGARNVSAGLLLFRRGPGGLEVFLAHPGGPFWADKDAGAWTVPKGLVEPGEDPLAAACREFEEETGVRPRGPYLPLGSVRQKAGKVIHAWAWEGDADPAGVTSNPTRVEWPRGSGRWLTFPEVDRCGWFAPPAAREKLNPAQAEFIDRLEAALGGLEVLGDSLYGLSPRSPTRPATVGLRGLSPTYAAHARGGITRRERDRSCIRPSYRVPRWPTTRPCAFCSTLARSGYGRRRPSSPCWG